MNLQQMMKQARDLEKRMKDLQDKLAEREVQGASGGGLVRVVMTCKGEVRKLEIAPSVINPADKETLEDLVMVAVNAARETADETMATETRRMMDELGLPPGLNLPGM